ncbi:ATP-binding protein [Arenimonas sp.]|uniref:hybrid sensor histidine kinase/response regulator n=1 Tax=Arenimonas sp. TaxID=1872635 RepID=UPI0035AF935B
MAAVLLAGLLAWAGLAGAVAPFRAFGVADGLPASQVQAIAQDRAGYLWLATPDGLARYDGLAFTVWRHVPGQPGSLPGNAVQSVFVDGEDQVWVVVQGQGLWHFDRDGGRFLPAAAPPVGGLPAVPTQLRDREGALWQAGPAGLRRVPAAGAEPGWPAPVFPRAVLALFEDREGGLWFGTRDDGLLALPAAWRSFSFVPVAGGGAPLLADAGGVEAWVARGASLRLLDLRAGREHEAVVRPALAGAPITALLARADGSLWLAQRAALSRLVFDAASGHWRRQSLPEAGGAVRQLLDAADGRVWLVGETGVEWRDAAGAPAGGLARPSAGALWRGPDGQPWQAGGGGLQRWVPGASRFEPVPGAPAGQVLDLLAEPDGSVWVASLGRLSRLQWNGRRLVPGRVFGPGGGVPATAGARLARDPRGALWLATPRGLLRLEPEGRQLRRFGVGDGLAVQELGGAALHVGASGLGVAATRRGLQLFDTRRLNRRDRAPPPLVFESLGVQRGSQRLALPASATLLRLQPGDRDLRVVARLVSFVDAPAHRYRFRLLGYDAGWVDVGAAGERVFPRLEAGSYPLEVVGAVSDGAWSEPRQLTLLVDPPWWGTRTALAALGVGVLGLLAWAALFHRARLRRREAWQLARARQQLAEQNSEAKTRFLATLGHEIRTPMTGVLGMAELLQGGELQPRQRAQVDAIQVAGRHLLRLVNDALDLARIEAGKLTLEDTPFALRPLLSELVGLLRPLAEAKGLAFSLRCDAAVPAHLRGDATRVRQILLNLASNAIKFCERGELAIHVGPRQPLGIVMVVRDTGPGLGAEQQARLFRRFEPGQPASADGRYGGSGLGLAISQELAAAMGGSISVQSEPGRGASFRVELPLPAVDSPPPAEATPPPEQPEGRRLLLVEDDAVVAAVVTGLLERQGHRVVHAAHGLAALSELQAGGFDLALLDLDLPGLDGFELARLLRAQGRRLPLLAITARADAGAEPQARAAGMDGFLRKPVTGAMLAEALAALDPARVPGPG